MKLILFYSDKKILVKYFWYSDDVSYLNITISLIEVKYNESYADDEIITLQFSINLIYF